jgi:ketosteroid isomerase-like protein
LLDPDAQSVDHRILGTWNAQGARAILTQIQGLRDVSLDAVLQDEDVLALGPDALLTRRMHSGTERVGGGVYERQFLVLNTFGFDGRLKRWEFFEVGDEARALARFDELTAVAPARSPVRRRLRPNAASKMMLGIEAGFAARDPIAIQALLSDRLLTVEHPTGVTYGREGQIGSIERMLRLPNFEFRIEVLATLGESLCLARRRVTASGTAGGRFDVAEYEMDHIGLMEADEHGCLRLSEIFASDHLGEAIVRLYELYAESLPEGPERSRAAGIARALSAYNGPVDPDRIAAVIDPATRNVDHRVFGTWTTSNAAELLRHYGQQLELAPDFSARIDDVLALGPDAVLVHISFYGTARQSGGAFENLVVVLFIFGADGRFLDAETFEAEQESEALARFDAVVGRVDSGPVSERFANAATRAVERGAAALAARDWEGFAALMAPAFCHYDRTRIAQLESDGREWLAAFRRMVEMTSAPPTYKLLATRGERLALFEMLWRGAGGDVGPSEIEWRLIVEVNDRGEHIAIVVYDSDDLDAAHAELDARYEAAQGDRLPAHWTLLRRWTRAVADRDWEAVASLCADGFVEHDHRSLSLLGVTQGVEAWLAAIRTVTDLAPDSVFRIRHFIPGARGYYQEGSIYGTREGGPFEIVINSLVEIDDQGLVARVDVYDDDRVFAASRWSALGIPVPPTAPGGAELDFPGRILAKPNAAMRAMTNWFDAYARAFETGAWDELRHACHPSFVFDSRRRMELLHGGSDLMVASLRERAAIGARPEWHAVGVFGDRVFVPRILWVGGPPDGLFEIEYLGVVECDENGLFTAFVLFDLQDAREAQREAFARWSVVEPDMAAVATAAVLADAFNEKNAAKWRAAFADDLVVEDHRLAGMERIDGSEAYTESVVALWKIAPDSHAEVGWRWLAIDRHGAITVARRTGTVPDGGGEFESEYLFLYLVRDGRITRVELFEMNALDMALARFEELRSTDPPRVPPNAASVWLHRFRLPFNARDWGALHGLYAPEVTYEDRQRHSLVSGGLDTVLSSLRVRAEAGFLAERIELLGTAGPRVAIQRMLWATGGDNDRTEVEIIVVQEVDDVGRLRASINFDPDDTHAAQRAAWARWAASDPDVAAVVKPIWNALDAFNEQSAAKWRAGHADDVVVEDHRLAGMGRIEGADAYTKSVVALWELAPVTRAELGWPWPALDRHGGMPVLRRTGTVPDGGDFESEYLYLCLTGQGRITHVELFEMNALDKALARFEELRPRSSDTRRAP